MDKYIQKAQEQLANMKEGMEALGIYDENVRKLANGFKEADEKAARERASKLLDAIQVTDIKPFIGLEVDLHVSVTAEGAKVTLVERKSSSKRASGSDRIKCKEHPIEGVSYSTWKEACLAHGLTADYFDPSKTDGQSRSGHREYRKLVEAGKAPLPTGLVISDSVPDVFVKA